MTVEILKSSEEMTDKENGKFMKEVRTFHMFKCLMFYYIFLSRSTVILNAYKQIVQMKIIL